jgi:Icc-related predicted phosphoesterase
VAIDSRQYCAARNALEQYREKLMAIQEDNSAMAGGIVVQQLVTANAQNMSELAAKFTKEERLEDLLQSSIDEVFSENILERSQSVRGKIV